MDEKHLLSSDQKLKSWGYGEWIEEPDQVFFEHEGIKCRIHRMFANELSGHIYGGHLCGYICIPKDHKYFGLKYTDIDIDIHGGLTYGEYKEDEYWIGFDCAHSFDYMPSIEYLMKTHPEFIKLKQKKNELFHEFGIDQSFVNKKYKNINFCIEQCKSMVMQVIAAN